MIGDPFWEENMPIDKHLSYYIHVEEMRPFGGNKFAAKPILSRHFTIRADEAPPPTGEMWAPSQAGAIALVRVRMRDWAQRNGYNLSEG